MRTCVQIPRPFPGILQAFQSEEAIKKFRGFDRGNLLPRSLGSLCCCSSCCYCSGQLWKISWISMFLTFFRHVGSRWIIFDQTRSHWITLDQNWSNWIKLKKSLKNGMVLTNMVLTNMHGLDKNALDRPGLDLV